MSAFPKSKSLIDNDKLILLIHLLPTEYRKPLSLYLIDRLDYKTVSMVLDMKVNLVKHRISKGAYLLKKMIGDKEYKKAFAILYGNNPSAL